VSLSSNERADRDAWRFLGLCCDAHASLGDTNTGGKFLFDLVDHIEKAIDESDAPGVKTMKLFVLRDPSAPTIGDAAATAYKVGTAPIGLWTKLISFYNAKNTAFLEAMFERSGVDVSSDAIQKLLK